MNEAPLRTEFVSKRYKRSRRWALHDVTFELPAGSITALVGPNGAGKSTLIRSFLGFERPDRGRVLVLGRDPEHQREAAVNALGYVPQAPALYRQLTLDDHLTIAKAGRPGFDRAWAASRLAAVGLELHRRPADLSGGEQAHLGLALALGTRAPVLLLDEPLAGLDPLARRDFLGLLVEDLRGRRAAALLSSHIVTDVEEACDRLLILGGGSLLLDTSLAEAKRRYSTVPAETATGRAIGTFAGPAGDQVALVEASANGMGGATLEEVVLGHLAAGRVRTEVHQP